MTPEQNEVATNEKFISNETKYKSELERLEQKYNGTLTPRDVVKEASKTTSPLHNWFDWEDDEAGEKWRLHQARMLITIIKVKVMFDGTLKEYRKYINVTIKDDDDKAVRYYVQTDKALKNPDMKQQVLAKALQEFNYWKRCYNDYVELEDIFKSAEKTEKKLKKKKILVKIEQ